MIKTGVNGKTAVLEPLDKLFDYWSGRSQGLKWDCLFVFPPWLKAWWNSFGSGREQYVCVVKEGERITGIAPLLRDGKSVSFMGDRDVCDFWDMIYMPGDEARFLNVLFERLREDGISFMDMGRLSPGSTLIDVIRKNEDLLQCRIDCEADERIYQLRLPGTWDGFLELLNGKQRHEVRRKLRRLEESGKITFRSYENRQEVDTAMNEFVRLFRLNRSDKALFMTDEMESFFRSVATGMSEAGMLRVSALRVNEVTAALTMCFDYQSTVYLYNNSYDGKYSNVSAGILSKVYTIRNSIEGGAKVFDFLKGDEDYKTQLGGMPVQLHNCRVELK